jgi:hypothetical protein
LLDVEDEVDGCSKSNVLRVALVQTLSRQQTYKEVGVDPEQRTFHVFAISIFSRRLIKGPQYALTHTVYYRLRRALTTAPTLTDTIHR